MKKILAIILGAMLVLSFAASAFAVHAEIPSETQSVVSKGSTQITLGGELRFRGWYNDQVGTATASAISTITRWNDIINDGNIAPITTNVESLTAVTTTTISASPTMYLPTDHRVAFTSTNSRRIDTNDLSVHGISTVLVRDRTESDSDAWYDARVRLTLKAEVTPNTIGYVALESNAGTTTSDPYTWGTLNQKQSDLNILEAWIQHTGSGLLGFNSGIKVGHMPLALGEKQFLDLTKYGTDAIVLFADPIKGLHVAALTAKAVEGSKAENDDINAYVALMTYKINDKNTVGFNYTLINGDDLNAIGISPDFSLRLHNFGAHANGSAGPLTYRAEVDYQLGRVEGPYKSFSDFDLNRIQAFAIFAELGLKLDPVTLFARYGYGSGDKDGDNKVEEFQTVLGRDLHSSFIYEYMIDGAATTQLIPSGSTTDYRSRGLANTSMYNIGAVMSPTKDLTIKLDGYYLRANNATQGQKNPAATNSTAKASDNIGVEADLKITYKIDRNLTYGVMAGYFRPGDYYEQVYDMNEMGLEARPVTALMHSLTLSF